MKRAFVILLSASLLATGVSFAAEPQPAAPKASDKTAPEPSRRSVKQSPPEPVYRPSEKISADSAVAFPVDI